MDQSQYWSRGAYSIVTLFINLYAEYIMTNAGLDEAQAGIKIARRNINNIRYADDTTLMAESKEELKEDVEKVKKMMHQQNGNINKYASWKS